MTAAPTSLPDPAQLLRRAFQAARAKSDDIATQLHPAWLKMAWERIGFQGPPRPEASRLLASFYRLRWDSLTTLRPRAHRIALLPRPDLIRVLGAVALHADRGRVRRSIGRTQRAALIDCVGETAYARLVAPPAANDSLADASGSGAMTLAELDPDRLAANGYALLQARAQWHCDSLSPWIRLALSPTSEFMDDSPAPRPDSTSDAVLDRLSDYFPEHAWLFGLSMDHVLSASKTA